jgi:hypothetical protein
MILLQGLCGNPEASSKITALFRDTSADLRLRTETAVCLLLQDGAKYHPEVVRFAEEVPIKFSQPGRISYDLNLRRRLFDELTSIRHRSESGIDPTVVTMGFTLLLEEAEQQRKSNQSGGKGSYYGEFIYADYLDRYLGTSFEPKRNLSIYDGNDGNELFWHDTVVHALDWWAKHEQEYIRR